MKAGKKGNVVATALCRRVFVNASTERGDYSCSHVAMRRVNRPQAGCYRNSSVAPGRRNGWKYNIKINALTLDVLPIARKLAMSLAPVP
jgi:hypothetical protein